MELEAFTGVKLISRKRSNDERGSFLKLFDSTTDGLADFHIRQTNYVVSKDKHTLRGLHYQTGEFSESKYFSVLEGKIQLTFLDLRPQSATYLKATSVHLDSPDLGLLIPRGFATGYCTINDNTVVLYFSDNFYNSAFERGVRWNDPYFNIPWKIDTPILSQKDAQWPDWV